MVIQLRLAGPAEALGRSLWRDRSDVSLNVKQIFTSYGKESFTLFGKQFFTLPGKEKFTLPGKEFFTTLSGSRQASVR